MTALDRARRSWRSAVLVALSAGWSGGCVGVGAFLDGNVPSKLEPGVHVWNGLLLVHYGIGALSILGDDSVDPAAGDDCNSCVARPSEASRR